MGRPADTASSPAPFPWRTVTIVWLLGSLIWFAAAGVSIIRFRRLLRYAPLASEGLCRQAADLTQQLLTFASGGAPVRETVSISSLVRDSASFALRGSNVRSELALPLDLWPVEVDPTQRHAVRV